MANKLALLAPTLAHDGATDDAPALNAAISQLAALGGGDIILPAGNIRINSSIVPAATVKIKGAGRQSTLIFVACATAVAQDSTKQLCGFGFSDVTMRPLNASYYGSTVFNLTSLQASLLSNLVIEGFTTGTIFSLGGVVPSTIVNSNLGGNVIFNTFADISVIGCAKIFSISGHYGATTTASPANSSNQPDQVVTANLFSNINALYVTGIGFDFIRAADTNTLLNCLVNLSADGAKAFTNGNDPSYTGNTYVNSNKFIGCAISKQAPVTTCTFFYSQNYTFGLEAIAFETDIDTSVATIMTVDMPTSVSHRLSGKRLDQNVNTLLGSIETGIAWKRAIVVSPSDLFVYAVTAGYSQVVLSGSGTFTAGQVQMPANPPDQLEFSIATTQLTVTTLTVASASGAGQSVFGSAGTISPSTPMRFRFLKGSNSWVRC